MQTRAVNMSMESSGESFESGSGAGAAQLGGVGALRDQRAQHQLEVLAELRPRGELVRRVAMDLLVADEGGVGERGPQRRFLGAHAERAVALLEVAEAQRRHFLDHLVDAHVVGRGGERGVDRKSTRLNSSHVEISYAVFCLKKKKK